MDVPNAVEFLKSRKEAAEGLLASLAAALSELPGLAEDDAAAKVQKEADTSIDYAVGELEQWKAFIDEGGLPSPDKAAAADAALATPIATSRRRTIQEKLAAMGGVPALGGGMALPVATAGQRRSLIATASPAAQELSRTEFVRLKSTESAAAQQISLLSKAHAASGQSDSTALDAAKEDEPVWKSQLKSRPPAAAPTPGPAQDLQSELAAAFSRRRQTAEHKATEGAEEGIANPQPSAADE